MSGPKIEPRGTPKFMGSLLDTLLLIDTIYVMFDKYELNHDKLFSSHL